MKIINYNYGYINAFDCSVHGKIVITKREWKQAITFLLRGARRWLPSYPWVASTLKRDITHGIETKRGILYNIRVPATETLVKKYNLKKYKRANYMFLILK